MSNIILMQRILDMPVYSSLIYVIINVYGYDENLWLSLYSNVKKNNELKLCATTIFYSLHFYYCTYL